LKGKTTLSVLCALLFGVVIGFCFAPIKKGVNIEIKNNGNGWENKE